MKKYILIITLLISYAVQSQFNNRVGRQRQSQIPQTQRQAPEPNFQVEKYLGIVVYDIEKAAKKSKIKLSSDTGKTFATLLTEYNKEIKDIRRINSFTLRSTKEMMENFQKNARSTGDLSNRTQVQQKMIKDLTPISEILKKKDRVFDKKVKALLSEKQYDKWIKYNRKMYKVFPKEEKEEKIEE